MIVTTEAVVLRSRKFRESSRIVTLYTRDFGKLSAIAKGARDRKSRFGASLQPMSHVSAVLYRKESRDLQLLTQCDLVEPFTRVTDDLARMGPGLCAIELVDAVTHGEDRNEALFRLLVRTLTTLDGATTEPAQALYLFEIGLLDVLGFRPDLQQCFNCGDPLDPEGAGSEVRPLRLSYGGVLCRRCSAKGMGEGAISCDALRVLRVLQVVPAGEPGPELPLTPGLRREVGETLWRFLRGQVEGLRALRSEAVLSQVM